jgi:dCTP deaminase
MINDAGIRELIAQGVITGARDHHIQPHSLDVRLSAHELLAQEGCWNGYQPIHNLDPIDPNAAQAYERITWRRDKHGDYIIMPPGCAWLGSTHEAVHLPADLVVSLKGCSTIARNFLVVHMTAGHIDAGFSGRITLEMCNFGGRPIILRPMMRIGQLTFSRQLPAQEPYQGRYQHQDEPTPARAKGRS